MLAYTKVSMNILNMCIMYIIMGKKHGKCFIDCTEGEFFFFSFPTR